MPGQLDSFSTDGPWLTARTNMAHTPLGAKGTTQTNAPRTRHVAAPLFFIRLGIYLNCSPRLRGIGPRRLGLHTIFVRE